MRKFFFLFLLIVATGCDEKPSGPEFTIGSYPLNKGNHWTYLSETTLVPLDTVPLPADIPLHQSSTIEVYVEKDTVLKDTAFVKKVVAESGGFTSIQFSYPDEEGLKTLAYYQAGIDAFAKKSTRPFPGIPIAGLMPLMFDPSGEWTEEIYFNNPPRLDLKLPLTSGLSWTYFKNSEGSYLINKSVSAEENIIVSGHRYHCFRISYEYVQGPVDGAHIRINEWISREGLIKREEVFDSLVFTDRFGDTDMGRAKLTSSMILTAIHIEP